MRDDYRERLAAAGFSRLEIAAVELAAVCCGLLCPCEHERPKFIECYPLDEEIDSDSGLTFTQARWQKQLAGVGFRPGAIALVEHALWPMVKRGNA